MGSQQSLDRLACARRLAGRRFSFWKTLGSTTRYDPDVVNAREAIMAKGQMRSNREAKKPKKAASADKAKPGAVSAFAKPPGATAQSHKEPYARRRPSS